MDTPKKKGSRIIGTLIIVLIFLFIAIEFFIREAQQFSATSITNILLTTLQIILFLLGLILLFVLGRNLIKLYLERRRKVVGSHFKTKLVLFFIALSFIPTLLLFFFASDLVSRNIEQWFRTPIDKILDDTRGLADGFYLNSAEITMHYAQQLSKAIEKQNLLDFERQLPLMEFVDKKLTEYKLDEIGIYLNNEELFSYLNPNLPLQYYQDLPKNRIQRAHLGELLRTIEPMGNGEMIRRGVSITIPEKGNLLVVAGKFLSQNYAQKITNITGYVKRYSQLKTERNDVKTFYLLTLMFMTMLIVFAASWIGFHLAKGITGPIEMLAQATKNVSRGNLDVRVEYPAADELGTLIDSFNQMITDLKESQQNIAQKATELEARKQYIETVLNNVATGVITLDAEGKITTINPSARHMLFLEEINLVGEDYIHVFQGPRYNKVVKHIQTGLNNKFPLSNKEISIDSGHQSKTLSLTLSPLTQNGRSFSGLILVFDDLTQLIKAQKIAAWKEVAQRVAHEIKNPLTPIQLSSERIIRNLEKSDAENSSVIQDSARTIVEEARTIKSLVDEFSNFARMPSLSLQDTDIHALILQTISLFHNIFNDVEIETQFSPDVPSQIKVDPEQMKRMLINLMDNAIDAMNKKGKVLFQTSYDQDQQVLKIEIADSGPGINLMDKDKLFLPHFSTKKKGTGLGLAIVNQVIEEHNGSIDVENTHPRGAKFTIQIPA